MRKSPSLPVHILGGVAATALLTLLLCAPAWADPFGEVARFPVNPAPYLLNERTEAFGVNPSEANAVFVGEEAPEKVIEGVKEPSAEYRIEKFSQTGGLQVVQAKPFKPSKGTPGIEGIAVDPSLGRVYVLALYERAASEKLVDAETPAAGTLYAFNTSNLGSAVPGAGAQEKKGELATPEKLRANGKGQGEALLQPTGIAVDPLTHDVVILGEVDDGANRHIAIERVTPAGVVRFAERYVDPVAEVLEREANSPVVSGAGTVFAQRNPLLVIGGPNNEEQIIELPGLASGSPPTPVFHFKLSPNDPLPGPVEELVEFDSENGQAFAMGGGLALVPGAEGSGRIWSGAEIAEQDAVEGESEPPQIEPPETISTSPGALAVDFQQSGANVSTKEAGWTGGRNETPNPIAACVIGFPLSEEKATELLAAGSEEKLFALAGKTAEVIEFGPGGEGCPHATLPAQYGQKIVASVGGRFIPEPKSVDRGAEVSFGSVVVEGNVLAVEWNFGDGTPVQRESLALPQQLTSVKHGFNAEGAFKVTETVTTDDLATPKVKAEREVIVSRPTATLRASPLPATVNQAVTFEGSAASAVNGAALSEYHWRFGDGSPETASKSSSTTAIETHAYGTPGTYTAELVVTDTEGRASVPSKLSVAVRAASGGAEGGTPTTTSPPAPLIGVLGYRVSLASTSLLVSPNGAVTLKINCLGPSSCSGSVTLRTLSAVSSGAGRHKAILTLARGSFKVAGGRILSVTLHLSRAAWTLLSRVHSLRARATIVALDSQGIAHTDQITVTLRAPRSGHKH